jgi:hypothetical protein
MPVPPREERGEMGKFVCFYFLSYLILFRFI